MKTFGKLVLGLVLLTGLFYFCKFSYREVEASRSFRLEKEMQAQKKELAAEKVLWKDRLEREIARREYARKLMMEAMPDRQNEITNLFNKALVDSAVIEAADAVDEVMKKELDPAVVQEKVGADR